MKAEKCFDITDSPGGVVIHNFSKEVKYQKIIRPQTVRNFKTLREKFLDVQKTCNRNNAHQD